MPRMPKYLKREWAFFLDERGRKKYNALCRKCEITDIVQRENDVVFTFTDNADPDAVVRLVGKYGREMKFVSGEKSKIIYKSDKNVLANTKTVLETLNRFSHSDYEA